MNEFRTDGLCPDVEITAKKKGELWSLEAVLRTCMLLNLKRSVARNERSKLMSIGCPPPTWLKKSESSSNPAFFESNRDNR